MPRHPIDGHYVGMEQYERLEAREQAGRDNASIPDANESTPSNIRWQYNFELEQHATDQDAFDRCVETFGYVPTVIALKGVSRRAKQLNDSYWEKKRKKAGPR